MAINYFKRYFFKGYTFIFIAYLTIIGLISYYFTNQEKTMLVEQWNAQVDYVNLAVVADAIKQYDTGTKYFLEFIFSYDLYHLYVISIFVFMGVFLCAELLKQKNDGIGAYCVTRQQYRIFLKGFCCGMILYLAAIIVLSMVILLVISHFVGGFSIGLYSIGGRQLILTQQIAAALCHIILLIAYTSIAMLISAMVSMSFDNLFFARIFPAVVFVVIPQVLGGTLANVFQTVGRVLCEFIPVVVMTNTQTLLSTVNNEAQTIVKTIIALLILAVIFIVIYKRNVNQFSKDYL